jgi:ribonuclease G
MQITRQRMRPEVSINTSEICPSCNGTGKVSPTLLLVDEIETRLNYLVTHQHKDLIITVHPYLYSHLKKGIFSIAWKWNRKYKTRIRIKSNSDYYLTEFHFFDSHEEEIKF